MANAVRKMREKLHNQKIEIEKQTEELTRANKDNKRLRDLLKDDHSAIKRYLGIVLGKNSTDLAPEEKMQVRTLLKDSTDDQASNTMAAWDTILNLKTQANHDQLALNQILELAVNDKCSCQEESVCKQIITLIE